MEFATNLKTEGGNAGFKYLFYQATRILAYWSHILLVSDPLPKR
jgi:hypothetical protein